MTTTTTHGEDEGFFNEYEPVNMPEDDEADVYAVFHHLQYTRQ